MHVGIFLLPTKKKNKAGVIYNLCDATNEKYWVILLPTHSFIRLSACNTFEPLR